MGAITAFLSGKKTYILVILGIITLLIHLLSGDMTLTQFLASDEFTALLGLLGIGALRAGVSKATPASQ